jgi:hypothetical protein
LKFQTGDQKRKLLHILHEILEWDLHLFQDKTYLIQEDYSLLLKTNWMDLLDLVEFDNRLEDDSLEIIGMLLENYANLHRNENIIHEKSDTDSILIYYLLDKLISKYLLLLKTSSNSSQTWTFIQKHRAKELGTLYSYSFLLFSF